MNLALAPKQEKPSSLKLIVIKAALTAFDSTVLSVQICDRDLLFRHISMAVWHFTYSRFIEDICPEITEKS